MKVWVEYNKSFFVSCLLHGLLLAFLLFNINSSISPSTVAVKTAKQPAEIVQAVVVESEEVDRAVAQLQAEEQKRQVAEEKRIKSNEQKVALAKQEKERIMMDLEKAKQSMNKLKEITKVEETDLAKIKLEREKEQQALANLKVEHQREKQRLAKMEEQKAEQQRLKENQEIKAREQKSREEKQLAENARKERQQKLAKAQQAKQDQALLAKRIKIENEAVNFLDTWGKKSRSNRRLFGELSPDTFSEVEVRVLPDGSVLPRLKQSSGNAAFDDSNLKAILKTPFVFPEDPSLKEKVKELIAKGIVLQMYNRQEGVEGIQ